MFKKILLVISSMMLSACSAMSEHDTSNKTNDYGNTEQSTNIAVQSGSLWESIPKGFKLKYDAKNAQIQKYQKWFLSNSSYLDLAAERSQPYIHHIYAEVKKRNLPTELVLLPVIESQYDPFAYSHMSAAGIWQLVPTTAQRFGVTQNWWFDGRRDLHDSTDAALDYIEYLHEFFDGNWLHVLAAYNSGEGTVQRAIRRNKSKGKPTDFWSLDLPQETRAFVPKILAVTELMKHSLKRLDLPKVSNEPHLTVVQLENQIDLALAASHAGLTLDEIYSYNPGLNHWATPVNGPHRLTLPKTHVANFEKNLKKTASTDWVKSQQYVVQAGDTLSEIAEKHSISVAVIKQSNQLESNTIAAGTALVIPTSVKSGTVYANTKHHLALANQSTEYTVKSGDSLWKISQSHDISINQIASLNNLKPTSPLKVGQKIVVQKASATSAQSTRQGSGILTVEYTVRNGDSLKTIANRFRVNKSDILSWNNLKKSSSIKPGQELTLYVKKQTTKI